MMISHFPLSAPGARRLLVALSLGGSLLAMSACSTTPLGDLDWDLRAGAGNTSEEARQATAGKPVPDANGVLSYPGYQLAAARKGETVASMAARLGLNTDELARTNALRPADGLRAGELLLLPKRVSAAPQPVANAPGGSRPVDITSIATSALDEVGPSATTPAKNTPGGGKEPLRHKVARGETAFTIARAYNVSARALADWNGLGPDMGVREGQTLIIPVATAPAPDPEPVPAAPGAGSPTPQPPSASQPLPDEKPLPASEKPKETPPSPDLGETATKATKLAMPVAGKIIRSYDKKTNQGIDISAPAGTDVNAAAAGTVAVISADTTGKGIIILRHPDNLLTVYVGVASVSVAKGAKVSRGQSLGKVAAGDPSFLHFEVRNSNKDSLDPLTFLQ